MKTGLEGVVLEGVELGGEVALAGVGEEDDDGLALVLRTLGNLGGSEGGSTAADAHEEAFLLRQLTAGADGVVVLYVEDLSWAQSLRRCPGSYAGRWVGR